MGEIVRQTFNLYNTVGLIDKAKNIYFVPHKEDIYAKRTVSRTAVCDCYYDLFNEVSPFSSKYQNTEISGWSPEDKVLRIKGIIDDFRQSRGQGLALNYMIVNRAIYEEDGVTLKEYYYTAFFIDSVEQKGLDSVLLNVSPDYFTNFYYLNVKDNLTSDYDPFNPVMKNCFIERQHYNRYEEEQDERIVFSNNIEKILLSEESFKYKYQYKEKREFLPIGVNLNEYNYENFCNQLKSINSKNEFISFVNSLTTNEKKILSQLFLSYMNVILKENILTSLSYKNVNGAKMCYKVGYNSYGGVSVPFVHIAIPFISIPDGFENIKKEWFSFGISLTLDNFDESVGYRVKIFYDENVYNPNRLLDYLQDIGATEYILTSFVSKYSSLQENIRGFSIEQNTLCFNYFVPLRNENAIEIVDGSGYWNLLREANKTLSLEQNSFAFLPFYSEEGETPIIKYVVDGSFGGWIDENLNTYPLFEINGNNQISLSSPLPLYETAQEGNYNLYRSSNENELFKKFVFIIGKSKISQFWLSLKSNEPSKANAKSTYTEPLINVEPYSFTSISIYETEQMISKVKLVNSYYDNYRFEFQLLPLISYNESYKIGLVPIYRVQNRDYRYYSEAVVKINSAEVPVVQDSWLSYYVTNKAQMKNQYAVQYTDYVMSIPTSLNTTLAKTISGGLKGGSAGAISGAVEGFTNMVNEGIDNWTQIEKIRLSQLAKMSDMGAKPDTIKFAGSDILYDLNQNERGFYLNSYKIDDNSYNSICKYLERYGYQVNIFDSINAFDRIGLNFVKINSFDFVEDDFVLSQEQMNAISEIFSNGVTLLHNKDYLHNLGEVIDNVSYHNYEYDLR